MENTIDVLVTRALLHLAIKEDIYSCINGVRVEFQADKTVYMATNNLVLGVYTDDDAKNECVFSLTIPYGIVKQIKLNAKVSRLGKLFYDPETKAARLVYYASGQDFDFTPLPNTYPDVSKVIPTKTSGKTAQFDAEYVYAFAQVNKALGAKYPGIFKIDHNGEQGAIVHLSDDRFTGVIMPVRI